MKLTRQWNLDVLRIVKVQRWPRDAEGEREGEGERERKHVNWCCRALHYWVGQGFASRGKNSFRRSGAEEKETKLVKINFCNNHRHQKALACISRCDDNFYSMLMLCLSVSNQFCHTEKWFRSENGSLIWLWKRKSFEFLQKVFRRLPTPGNFHPFLEKPTSVNEEEKYFLTFFFPCPFNNSCSCM